MNHHSAVDRGVEPDGPHVPRRLESWKEIAAHFGRDPRTVRRWERAEGLPVHRHLHQARGSVYAFADELDRWWEDRPMLTTGGGRARGPGWPRVVLAASLGFSALALALFVAPAVARRQAQVDPAAASEAGAPPSRTLPDDPQAREAFLVARHQLTQRTGLRQQALESLELVVAREPAFAEAQALLGEAYLRQAIFNARARPSAWAKAEAAARRALALDADLAPAHTVLGRILLLRDWNWTGAEAEIARSLALAPRDLEARSTYALYLRSTGRLDLAIAERQRVQQADPLNAHWLVALGDEYAFARRYDDALRCYHRALKIERDYRPAVAGLADVLPRTGRLEEAATWRMRHLRLTGRDDLAAGYDTVRRADGVAAAERWLDRRRLDQYSRDVETNAWNLAYTHARLGEREKALQFLELAWDRRDPGLLQARVDPDMDSLRADPRFLDLLQRIGPHR